MEVFEDVGEVEPLFVTDSLSDLSCSFTGASWNAWIEGFLERLNMDVVGSARLSDVIFDQKMKNKAKERWLQRWNVMSIV